jgi:hypothetical protein
MLPDALILAVPVVLVLGGGAVYAAWDTKRWEARCKAAARPVPVRLFPNGPEPLYAPLDTHAGRAARRARHTGDAR